MNVERGRLYVEECCEIKIMQYYLSFEFCAFGSFTINRFIHTLKTS
jgi:hypothetical protein